MPKRKPERNEKAVDELLVELQADKQELESKIKLIKDKEEKLGHLIKKL